MKINLKNLILAHFIRNSSFGVVFGENLSKALGVHMFYHGKIYMQLVWATRQYKL